MDIRRMTQMWRERGIQLLGRESKHRAGPKLHTKTDLHAPRVVAKRRKRRKTSKMSRRRNRFARS